MEFITKTKDKLISVIIPVGFDNETSNLIYQFLYEQMFNFRNKGLGFYFSPASQRAEVLISKYNLDLSHETKNINIGTIIIPDNSTSIESVKEKINEFYESF